jgi:uncharacterized protein YkwD
MKKIIVLLLILASPLFAEKGTSNFKKVFTQEEKQIFLDSMNKYRSMIGVKPVKYLKDVERLANTRIETIYNHLKDISDTISEKELRKNCLYHLHFGMYIDVGLFDIGLKMDKKKSYLMPTPSECIAVFFKDESNMVESLFNGWRGSPSHWGGMMGESNDTIALEMKKTDQGIIACLILFEKYNKK